MQTQTPEQIKMAEKAAKSLGFNSISAFKEKYNPATVTSLSTPAGADVLGSNIKDQDADMAALVAKGGQGTTPAPTPVKKTQKNPAMDSIGVTPEEANALGIDVSNFIYDEASGYLIDPKKTAAGQLESQFNKDEERLISDFDKRMGAMDAANREIVDGLKGMYSSRIAAQAEANKRSLARYNTLGIRGGSRYAPEVNAGILAAEEREGLSRITEIATEEAMKIAQAKMSLQDKKYTEFVQFRDDVKELRKEKQATLLKLQESAIEREKESKEAIEKEEQDYYDRVTKPIEDIGIKLAEKNAPIDIREAVANAKTVAEALTLAGNSLYDENEVIDARYKKAQTDKILAELAEANNPTTTFQGTINGVTVDASGTVAGLKIPKGTDAVEIIAYASQYAATGKIPTGMPKGVFGVVSQVAKELPKQRGQILDTATGVSPDGGDTATSAYASLYSAIELSKELKELDKKRWGGIVSGTLGKIFGSEDQQNYIDLREQIVDLLSRARSGAALTVSEETRYKGMLPGRLDESFGLGADSDVRIDNFISTLSSDLKNKTSSKGWSVNGLSEVKVGDQKYTVGDVIDNGSGGKGRINADGTITIMQSK